MKKVYLFLSVFLIFIFLNINISFAESSEIVTKGPAYDTLSECNEKKDYYNGINPDATRSNCYQDANLWYYNYCENGDTCESGLGTLSTVNSESSLSNDIVGLIVEKEVNPFKEKFFKLDIGIRSKILAFIEKEGKKDLENLEKTSKMFGNVVRRDSIPYKGNEYKLSESELLGTAINFINYELSNKLNERKLLEQRYSEENILSSLFGGSNSNNDKVKFKIGKIENTYKYVKINYSYGKKDIIFKYLYDSKNIFNFTNNGDSIKLGDNYKYKIIPGKKYSYIFYDIKTKKILYRGSFISKSTSNEVSCGILNGKKLEKKPGKTDKNLCINGKLNSLSEDYPGYYWSCKGEDKKIVHCKAKMSKICSQEYKPVCAQGGIGFISSLTKSTYSNKCMAEAQGAKILYEGECKENSNNDKIYSKGLFKLEYNGGDYYFSDGIKKYCKFQPGEVVSNFSQEEQKKQLEGRYDMGVLPEGMENIGFCDKNKEFVESVKNDLITKEECSKIGSNSKECKENSISNSINVINTGSIVVSNEICIGTKPTGEGLIISKDEKKGNYTTWNYNIGTTKDWNCSWGCKEGYSKSGSGCIKSISSDDNNKVYSKGLFKLSYNGGDYYFSDGKEKFCKFQPGEVVSNFSQEEQKKQLEGRYDMQVLPGGMENIGNCSDNEGFVENKVENKVESKISEEEDTFTSCFDDDVVIYEDETTENYRTIKSRSKEILFKGGHGKGLTNFYRYRNCNYIKGKALNNEKWEDYTISNIDKCIEGYGIWNKGVGKPELNPESIPGKGYCISNKILEPLRIKLPNNYFDLLIKGMQSNETHSLYESGYMNNGIDKVLMYKNTGIIVKDILKEEDGYNYNTNIFKSEEKFNKFQDKLNNICKKMGYDESAYFNSGSKLLFREIVCLSKKQNKIFIPINRKDIEQCVKSSLNDKTKYYNINGKYTGLKPLKFGTFSENKNESGYYNIEPCTFPSGYKYYYNSIIGQDYDYSYNTNYSKYIFTNNKINGKKIDFANSLEFYHRKYSRTATSTSQAHDFFLWNKSDMLKHFSFTSNIYFTKNIEEKDLYKLIYPNRQNKQVEVLDVGTETGYKVFNNPTYKSKKIRIHWSEDSALNWCKENYSIDSTFGMVKLKRESSEYYYKDGNYIKYKDNEYKGFMTEGILCIKGDNLIGFSKKLIYSFDSINSKIISDFYSGKIKGENFNAGEEDSSLASYINNNYTRDNNSVSCSKCPNGTYNGEGVGIFCNIPKGYTGIWIHKGGTEVVDGVTRTIEDRGWQSDGKAKCSNRFGDLEWRIIEKNTDNQNSCSKCPNGTYKGDGVGVFCKLKPGEVGSWYHKGGKQNSNGVIGTVKSRGLINDGRAKCSNRFGGLKWEIKKGNGVSTGTTEKYYNAWCKGGKIVSNKGKAVKQSFNGCGVSGKVYKNGDKYKDYTCVSREKSYGNEVCPLVKSYYNAWCKGGKIVSNKGKAVKQSFNGCGVSGKVYKNGDKYKDYVCKSSVSYYNSCSNN